MQLLICLCIVLAALSSAKQLEIGPPILNAKSSSEPSQRIDKRFVAPEFNFYLNPEQVKALQIVKSSQNSGQVEALNSGISQESLNELIQKYYAENLKPAPIEEPQEEQASNIFLPRGESIYNKNQNFNINTYRQLLMDQSKLSGHAQNLGKKRFNQLTSPSLADSDLVSNNPEVAKDQEEKLLQKQLNQQWIRILNQNKNQLKGILVAPEEEQIYRGYAEKAAFLKPASGVNSNEDQRKSAVDKEIEFILRNGQNYQPKHLFSPNQARFQNGRNGYEKKSAVEKEIENVWRQHQAFEFERSNAPAELSRQSLSAGNENQGKLEVDKKLEYIFRNGQAYGLKKNFPTGINNQEGRNEEQNEHEAEREIDNFWRIQQDSQFQRSYIPAGVIRGPLSRNENQGKSEVDKQIENILKQQAFVFGQSNVADVRNQNPMGKNENENQNNSEVEKQIEFILRSRQAEFERKNVPEIKNQSPSINADQNTSEVEKEIQNILKKHQDFEIQRSKETAKVISQSPPILVHKHVSIIKHRPVPVLKNVQVPVPTPVLVPIPQPYEVKVTQLYPVPLKVVKHVPVPVLY